MKKIYSLIIASFVVCSVAIAAEKQRTFLPNHPLLHYMGRIYNADKLHPKLWASAAQVQFSFKGSNCSIIISDEMLYGNHHNYIDIIVDGKYKRIKLQQKKDTIQIATGLLNQQHSVIISKSTEASIGYIVFEGVICKQLIKAAALPTRKIESFGDSITSSMGSDTSITKCNTAAWYDQTNGYFSYAAITGRALNAQYHLSSVSGIGMVRSCCDMDILMPQVYDKISLRDNTIPWNFSKYQPDVVTICLGQNDGIQDSTLFCSTYTRFVLQLRKHYPKASIVLLSSPMADAALKAALVKYLTSIKEELIFAGQRDVHTYFFAKQSIAGCDSHPSLSEQKQIAEELSSFIKKIKKW